MVFIYGSLTEVGPLLRCLLTGDYEGVLRSPVIRELLGGEACCHGDSIEAHLERRLLAYLSDAPEDSQSDRVVVVFVLAVACLHLFAQSNWTGPSLSLNLPDLLPPSLLAPLAQPEALSDELQGSLVLDGEAVYSLVSNPFLLLLARVVLLSCSPKMEQLQLLPWWTLRYVNLHQQLLDERSPQLHGLGQSSMDTVLKCESLFSDQCFRDLAIQFHLECMYTSLFYWEYQQAREHVEKAKELTGLEFSTTGALGKRTHFQHSFLAQLILEVKRKEESDGPESDRSVCPVLPPTPVSSLPKDQELGDDTVLNQINLADPGLHQVPSLSAEDQAVLLGFCTNFQKSNPVHNLTEEELLAFTSVICIHDFAFTRSCTPPFVFLLQLIADHFEDPTCPVSERLKIFYCCQAPPRWSIQSQLASLLMDLGCTSSALLLYEEMQLWEDVVICHEKMGKHGKAEEVLRRELEKKETPSLYCLLGDVLRDHQYYDRAWELSGQRSARAMRSKALLHLRNKEFQQCVDCFEHSLRVNAMQLGVWFSLGCAYFALEGYAGAARAFKRCVNLEPDNAEAWNNLSTAYIRLKQKPQAFRTLQEALKCNYEHWQIWENFLTVCIDVGEFSEAIKAYHHLMELREKYKDVEILQILVRAVVEDLPDNQDQKAGKLRSKLQELLGRVTARHSSDGELWRQYALLYGNGQSTNQEDNEKALRFLVKAHHCQMQNSGWEKETGSFKEAITRAVDVGNVTLSCSQKKTNPQESLQMLSSARLSLKSLATKAKQMHTDVATGDIHSDLTDSVGELERVITELQDISATLRGQSE
uniref:Tetratricopeptide repeat protein 27 n=1 Tax=Gadus morhua TaxID=8049 RepID=A0A8C4ZP21_GADMO